ncbi:MAG: lysophospholipid acyltransferase family protein [Desulfobacterales bacterium]|nr:lysophospholipid acyltransferase family protein [Desulfobacterales bacterium]
MASKTEKLQYLLIGMALKGLSAIPQGVRTRLAGPVGRLWYGLDRYHRRIAEDNMQRAYAGEISAGAVARTVRANFVQTVRMALEIPSLLRLDRKNIDRYVTFTGEHHLRCAMARGRGILFLTGHLGNWEMMSLSVPLKFGLRINVLARPLDFRPLDRVLTEIRSRTGNRMVDKEDSAKEVQQRLNANQAVGILLDQNASFYEGVYVPFFSRLACTNRGLAVFALRYRADVIPVFNIREPDGRYRVIFEAPLTVIRTGNVRRDIVENTEVFNRVIEKFVRRAPEQWFWVHRRWRIKKIPQSVRGKVMSLSSCPIADEHFYDDTPDPEKMNRAKTV